MKALGDSVIFGETEHADNGFKPLAERLGQRMEMLCGLASHLLHAVLEFSNERQALCFCFLFVVK